MLLCVFNDGSIMFIRVLYWSMFLSLGEIYWVVSEEKLVVNVVEEDVIPPR